MRLAAILAAAAAVLLPARPLSALGPSDARPLGPSDPLLLYVCIQDDAKIAVVDMDARAVVRTIDLQSLGFSATAKPHYVVVEPDGSHWYVSLIGENRILKFDRDDRVVGQYETEVPGMLALVPDSNLLVASRSMSAVNPPRRIALIDRRSMTGEEVDVVFPRPHPVAVSAGYAYTGSLGVNQVAAISLEDLRPAIVSVEGPTHSLVQFAVSPDGRTLVATAEISGRLLVFDLADPARPALTRSVAAGTMAFDPAFVPDGREVWVPIKSTNELVVFDTATWTVTARVTSPVFAEPHQVVFSPDGSTAFVTNNNKMDHMADPAHAGHEMPERAGSASLAIVDVASRAVVSSIALGRNLTGMGTRGRE